MAIGGECNRTNDWQPIETVPREARVLVVGGDVDTVQTAWTDREGRVWCDLDADRWIDGDPPDRPTHWMPLPVPPEEVE